MMARKLKQLPEFRSCNREADQAREGGAHPIKSISYCPIGTPISVFIKISESTLGVGLFLFPA